MTAMVNGAHQLLLTNTERESDRNTDTQTDDTRITVLKFDRKLN